MQGQPSTWPSQSVRSACSIKVVWDGSICGIGGYLKSILKSLPRPTANDIQINYGLISPQLNHILLQLINHLSVLVKPVEDENSKWQRGLMAWPHSVACWRRLTKFWSSVLENMDTCASNRISHIQHLVLQCVKFVSIDNGLWKAFRQESNVKWISELWSLQLSLESKFTSYRVRIWRE